MTILSTAQRHIAKLPSQSVVTILNRLLARETWARKRLAPYAGHSVSIGLPFCRIALVVQADGQFAPMMDATDAEDVNISMVLSAGILSAWLTQGWAAMRPHITIHGDAEFAAVLGFLAEHLRWDVEEELAGVVGDVPAHWLVSRARAAHRRVSHGARHFIGTAAEYWLDENPQLVRNVALADFSTEVADLRDAVARLEKRVARLGECTS